MKTHVTFDLDEVLVPTKAGFIAWLNAEHGYKLTMDHPEYSICHQAGLNEGQDHELVRAFIWQGGQDKVEPLPGAVRVLQRAHAEGMTVTAITARDILLREATEKMLGRCFPNLIHDVCFCSNHQAEPGLQYVEKYLICQRLESHRHFDDHPEHIVCCLENGVEATLFGDYAWNRDHQHHSRARDWNEVEQLLFA